MIVFAILLLIIILILLLSFKGNTKRKLERLEQELIVLKKMVAQQTREPFVPPAASAIQEEQAPVIVTPVKPKEDYWKSGFDVVPEPQPTFRKEEWLPKEEPLQQEVKEEKLQPEEQVAAFASPMPPVTPAPPPVIPAKPRKPSFFERNPDLEKFIGENLVSKIGIAILVLAIGYFVKYAIDNEWIGTVGRVAVGIACGGILIAIAHRLRNNYHAFSSVLAGGGLAIFYFTITLAFQQYHLFSQTVAFVIMLVITAFAVLLSLLYNRQELAIIALTGGFAAPFLISSGNGNYVTLFIYLIVLNTGLLLIAYHKSWRIVNTTAFVFTVILFASWLYSLPYNEPTNTYQNAFLFATIFYVLFLAINIANNIKEKKQFVAFDFSILLANTGLFFSAGLYCLFAMKATQYNGLFSAIMGVFNLGVSYFLLRKKNIDTNILYLLIGITLTFVSLTAPLQLHGHFITLFWASEAVLLCWLYLKSQFNIIQYASLLVHGAMLLSLLGDWNNVYETAFYNNASAAIPIIINRGFITTIYVAIASFVLYRLLHKNHRQLLFLQASVFRNAAILLLFAAGYLEIRYQLHHYFSFANVAALYLELYTFIFVLLLLFVSRKVPGFVIHQNLTTGLLIGCVMVYLFMLPLTSNLQDVLLSKTYSSYSYLFLAHWLVALLIAVILYRLAMILAETNSKQKNIVTWMLCTAVVWYLSMETYLLTEQLFYGNTQDYVIDRVFVKTVLPVLWGLCSFGFMWLGMKYKYKTLRIVSLSLFTLNLLKLFVYDISNIPVAGKIAAFFCLGVLLLIISFMYQRLKKMIIEDEAKPRV